MNDFENPKQEPTQRVEYCPHCGNTTPLQVVGSSTSHDVEDGQSVCETRFYLMSCKTCTGTLLFAAEYVQDDGRDLHRAQLVWPTKSNLDIRVPAAIRECYEEAYQVKVTSPMAFAVLIRRSLEAVCSDRGVQKRSLAASLQALVEQDQIPLVCADMTKVIKAIGNYGAHFTDMKVNASQVKVIDDFFRALIEYVYVAPAKISDFQARIGLLSEPPLPLIESKANG